MDGIALCSALRTTPGVQGYIYTILLTARDSIERGDGLCRPARTTTDDRHRAGGLISAAPVPATHRDLERSLRTANEENRRLSVATR